MRKSNLKKEISSFKSFNSYGLKDYQLKQKRLRKLVSMILIKLLCFINKGLSKVKIYNNNNIIVYYKKIKKD